jgi:hypothetical protein
MMNALIAPACERWRLNAKYGFYPSKQGCGSGSGFSDLVDPDPYWESGSGGKKMKKFQWKNALFSYRYLKKKKSLPPKRYKIALTTF